MVSGVGFIGNSSVLSRAERHIGRSLRFSCLVGVFNRGILRTGDIAFPIVGTMGAKLKRPSRNNCQLSIVNCQFREKTVHCPLSTVNSLPLGQLHLGFQVHLLAGDGVGEFQGFGQQELGVIAQAVGEGIGVFGAVLGVS